MFQKLWLNLRAVHARSLNLNFLVEFKYFYMLGLLSLFSSCILLFWSLKQNNFIEDLLTTIKAILTTVSLMLYFLSCAYNRHNIRLCYVKCLDVLSYNKNTSLKMSSVFIISGMHMFWLVVFFVNSVTTQEPAVNLVLQAQDFVCFVFEMQFYVILLLVKSSLEMITHRISDFFHMIKSLLELIFKSYLLTFNWKSTFNHFCLENNIDAKILLPDYFANCLEDTRLLHMEIFDIMVKVNRIYGLDTLIIIIQSRILFAINLYSFITNYTIMELIESMATFQRIALLCYCSELIKRNENIIKSLINEMDTNLLPGENFKQQRLLFNHQVEKLKFDLDAYEMFPINLETLLTIIITTASYLLLFSQLNLTLYLVQ